MSAEIRIQPTSQRSSPSQTIYSAKLQDTLDAQREQAKEIQQKQSQEIAQAEQTKQAETAKNNDKKQLETEDQISIGKAKWAKNQDGKYELQANIKDPLITSVDLKNDGQAILRLLGQKIDFTAKLPKLQQAYLQTIVQSKSSNFFLSKYAQFKMGIMGQMLTSLGMTSAELQLLQKKALEGAVSENISNMSENIYSMELTDLLYGKGRKSRKAMSMYTEAQQQLTQQMALLGKENYWTKTRLLEEKIRQIGKMKEEFKQEKDALSYQYEFLAQEINK